MSNLKSIIKYTKKTHRDTLNGRVTDIWHQEIWSIDGGRYHVEHSIEDGDYLIGVGRGGQNPQHPLSFKSLEELREFLQFTSRAVLDSVVIPIPRERRHKKTYLRR